MRGKQWPKSKKIEVIESYALSESLATTSRETGVPKSSVARWVTQNREEIERLKERNREIRERALESSLEVMARRHSLLGQKMQEVGQKHLDSISRRPTLTAVASLIKGGVDIERLAAGQASEVVGLSKEVLDALIKRQAQRLREAAEAGVVGSPDSD